MTALVETSEFPEIVTQLEVTTPVLGGLNGPSNVPHIELAKRTRWLKDQVDSISANLSAVAAQVAAQALRNVPKILTLDYGATGDGVADDTFALLAAFAAGGSLYVPPGRYRITADCTCALQMYIFGDGAEQSEFVLENDATILFSGGNSQEYNSKAFRVDRVGVRVATQSVNSAVKVLFTGVPGGTPTTFIADGLDISGVDGNTGFARGLELNGARTVRLTNCRIMGDRNNSSNMNSVSGIEITGTSSPVEFFIDKCTFYFVQAAIYFDGECEGLYVNQCAALACWYGVFATSSAVRPLAAISNCHFNTYKAGFVSTSLAQYFITNNLFYGFASPFHYVAMQLEMPYAAPVSGIIAHNTIVCDAAANPNDCNGIAIQNTALGYDSILVDGNQFVDLDTGVILSANTDHVVVTASNIFTNVNDHVLDSGSNNIVAGIDVGISPDDMAVRGESGDFMVAGSTTVNLDANGDGVGNFFRAFPNAFYTAVVCNGDPTVQGDAVFSLNQTACNQTSFAVSVRPNPGAIPVRVNYIAHGR